MKKVFLAALAASVLTAASYSSMAKDYITGEPLNPWQDCGIGAMVFPDNGAAAAISNIIWDLGTTALSTKVSSAESCSSTKAKTAMFIKATQPSLEQDIATGQGEYLTAMLELRGCASESHGQIVDAVRSDLAAAIVEDAEALFNTVETRITASFSTACSA